jgi:hypothetical protein
MSIFSQSCAFPMGEDEGRAALCLGSSRTLPDLIHYGRSEVRGCRRGVREGFGRVHEGSKLSAGVRDGPCKFRKYPVSEKL